MNLKNRNSLIAIVNHFENPLIAIDLLTDNYLQGLVYIGKQLLEHGYKCFGCEIQFDDEFTCYTPISILADRADKVYYYFVKLAKYESETWNKSDKYPNPIALFGLEDYHNELYSPIRLYPDKAYYKPFYRGVIFVKEELTDFYSLLCECFGKSQSNSLILNQKVKLELPFVKTFYIHRWYGIEDAMFSLANGWNYSFVDDSMLIYPQDEYHFGQHCTNDDSTITSRSHQP